MKVRYRPQARKYLRKLARSQPDDYRRIDRRIDLLAKNPEPPDSASVRGGPQARRVRVGDHRIIYQIEEDALVIVCIGKRNDGDVYRRWGR